MSTESKLNWSRVKTAPATKAPMRRLAAETLIQRTARLANPAKINATTTSPIWIPVETVIPANSSSPKLNPVSNTPSNELVAPTETKLIRTIAKAKEKIPGKNAPNTPKVALDATTFGSAVRCAVKCAEIRSPKFRSRPATKPKTAEPKLKPAEVTRKDARTGTKTPEVRVQCAAFAHQPDFTTFRCFSSATSASSSAETSKLDIPGSSLSKVTALSMAGTFNAIEVVASLAASASS